MTEQTKDGQTNKQLIGNPELRSMFWRSFLIQSSWSFDKMMAYGQMYGIEKSLRKIYPDDDDYYDALKRHCETFNVTPHISPFIMAISVAMEEKNAQDPEFDTSSINKVKIGLMGPLSGIGDSFFWGTFRVIAAGIGIGIAKKGNILGSILYFLIYTSIHFIAKWLSAKYGYSLGTKFLNQAEGNHSIEKLSYGASILGLTVIGAMVTLNAKLQFNLSGTVTKLQSIFDQIFPGLLPLGVTFLCLLLLKKNVKMIYIIIGIFVLAILGSWVNIF